MRRRATARDEQGAVAVMMAVLICFLMIPLTALVVDIGVQRVARSDMQAMADTVALDMSRLLGTPTPPTNALAQSVAARTDGTVGSEPTVKVRLGYIPSGAAFVSNQSWGCDPTQRYNSYFTDPSGKTPNAVLVVASTSVDFALTPGRGGACRSAIAGASEGGPGGGGVCYDVGSLASAVSLNRANVVNQLFSQMVQQVQLFGNSGAVMALDYKGLARTQISLDSVATTLGFASVNSLATGQVNVKSFFDALRAAMVTTDATNEAALRTLRDQVYNQNPMPTVPMSKLLTITAGAGTVTGMNMSALDLVAGALTARSNAVNGSSNLSVNIASALPGLVNGNGQVKLMQGPHRFCGAVGESTSTTTDSSLAEQLRVATTANLSSTAATFTVPAITGLMGTGTAYTSAPNNWTSVVSVAPTTTTLKAVECSAGVQGVTVDVKNGAARVTLEPTYIQLQSLKANILGKGVTTVNGGGQVSVEASITSANPDFSIRVPSQAFDTFYPSQTSPKVTYTVTVSNAYVGYVAGLKNPQMDQILAQVMAEVVRPMFDTSSSSSFINTTINPLLALLGTEAGGTDIALSSNPAIACGGGAPEIRG